MGGVHCFQLLYSSTTTAVSFVSLTSGPKHEKQQQQQQGAMLDVGVGPADEFVCEARLPACVRDYVKGGVYM